MLYIVKCKSENFTENLLNPAVSLSDTYCTMKTLPRIREATELVVDHSRTELRLIYGRRIWRLQELRRLHAPGPIIEREAAMVAQARTAWLMACQ